MTDAQEKAILGQIEQSTSRIAKLFADQYELIAVFNNNLLLANRWLAILTRTVETSLVLGVLFVLLRFVFKII